LALAPPFQYAAPPAFLFDQLQRPVTRPMFKLHRIPGLLARFGAPFLNANRALVPVSCRGSRGFLGNRVLYSPSDLGTSSGSASRRFVRSHKARVLDIVDTTVGAWPRKKRSSSNGRGNNCGFDARPGALPRRTFLQGGRFPPPSLFPPPRRRLCPCPRCAYRNAGGSPLPHDVLRPKQIWRRNLSDVRSCMRPIALFHISNRK